MPHRDVLAVRALSKHFGGIRALHDISFSVARGSINSLIGPNGAGKTTFINVVTGVFGCEGEISFEGENIAGLPAHVVASKGIGRTFQLEELFPSLTVLENVMVGCHIHTESGMLSCGMRIPSSRKEESEIRVAALECLKVVDLERRANEPISKLPLGERKLVGVARALAMNPSFLMLDEPAGGLAAHEIRRLVKLIHMLASKGLTILIVEHNMSFVMSLSERVIVFDQGTKIAEGTPDEVRANEAVIKAYLGEPVSSVDAAHHMRAKRSPDRVRLRVEGLSAFYGEAQALKDIHIELHSKEIVAILGSNGAGKTTLLKTVNGFVPPTQGAVVLDGSPIEGRSPHEIIRLGIASVAEGRELFGPMSVKDNLLLGAYSLASPVRSEAFDRRLELVFSLFPLLKERLQQRSETLSGGQQQMLALARALMAMPKVLALDEPSLGVSPLMVAEIMCKLREICDALDVSILLVEQNAKVALEIADYVYVLERGAVVLQGASEDVIDNPTIQKSYLGG